MSARTPNEMKAVNALTYLMARISADPELAYRFLHTEAYERVSDALAALNGSTAAAEQANFAPRRSYCCLACLASQRLEEEVEKLEQAERRGS